MLGLGVNLGRQKVVGLTSSPPAAPQEYTMVVSSCSAESPNHTPDVPAFELKPTIGVSDTTTKNILFNGESGWTGGEQSPATASITITRAEDSTVGYCSGYVYYSSSPNANLSLWNVSLSNSSSTPSSDVIDLATDLTDSEGSPIDLTPLDSTASVNIKEYTVRVILDDISEAVTVGSTQYLPLQANSVTFTYLFVYADQSASLPPLLSSYTSDFTADVDGWDFYGPWGTDPTITAYSTSISGKRDLLKVELNSEMEGTSSVYRTKTSYTNGWKSGDKVLVHFNYYSVDNAPSNTVSFQVRLGSFSAAAENYYSVSNVVDDQWNNFNHSFTLLENVSVLPEDFLVSFNSNSRPGSGDVVYFKDFYIFHFGNRG